MVCWWFCIPLHGMFTYCALSGLGSCGVVVALHPAARDVYVLRPWVALLNELIRKFGKTDRNKNHCSFVWNTNKFMCLDPSLPFSPEGANYVNEGRSPSL